MRNPEWTFGALLLGLVLVGMVLAPVLAPADPTAQDLYRSLERPGVGAVLGRDELGRDIWSRLLHGSRLSLGISAAAVLLGAGPGVALGAAAGLYGGWTDRAIMAVMDVLLAFPGFLLALAVVAVLGPGSVNLVLALAVFSVPSFARQTRAQVLAVQERLFVQAARALGAAERRVFWRHLLPSSLGPLTVLASHRVGQALLTAAGLSYLGLGAQPPDPEWGAMLFASRDYLFVAPHLMLAPGLAITLTSLGCNLTADGLRLALDPLQRR